MNTILTIVLIVVAFIVGAIATYIINKTLLASRAKTIIDEAQKEAEVLTKNKLLEVKEEFLQRKAELEKQVNSRNSKLQSAEAKLKQRELQLNQQQGELQRRKNEADAAKANYEKQLEVVEKKEQELDKLHRAEIEHLERISGLSMKPRHRPHRISMTLWTMPNLLLTKRLNASSYKVFNELLPKQPLKTR